MFNQEYTNVHLLNINSWYCKIRQSQGVQILGKSDQMWTPSSSALYIYIYIYIFNFNDQITPYTAQPASEWQYIETLEWWLAEVLRDKHAVS